MGLQKSCQKVPLLRLQTKFVRGFPYKLNFAISTAAPWKSGSFLRYQKIFIFSKIENNVQNIAIFVSGQSAMV